MTISNDHETRAGTYQDRREAREARELIRNLELKYHRAQNKLDYIGRHFHSDIHPCILVTMNMYCSVSTAICSAPFTFLSHSRCSSSMYLSHSPLHLTTTTAKPYHVTQPSHEAHPLLCPQLFPPYHPRTDARLSSPHTARLLSVCTSIQRTNCTTETDALRCFVLDTGDRHGVEGANLQPPGNGRHVLQHSPCLQLAWW